MIENLRSSSFSKRINTHVWTLIYSEMIEAEQCNYEVAIEHLINVHHDSANRKDILSVFGITLLEQSADNEAESFKIFQEAFDQPSDREVARFFHIGEEYRKLKNWNQYAN